MISHNPTGVVGNQHYTNQFQTRMAIPYANMPAWHNGHECFTQDLTVSIMDLGLIHGDATYDVIAFKNNQPLKLDWHLERFINSCRAWRLPLNYTQDELTRIISSVHQRTGWDDSVIWMSITRGIPASGNPRDLLNCSPELMIYAKPYQKFNGTNQARVCSARSIQRIPDVSINQCNKNFAWQDLTQAQWEAIDLGYDTALLFGTTGFLSEGPGFNVAIVADGGIISPATNRLPGVSMRLIENLADQLNIPFKWADITEEQTNACNDMFLTTTIGNLVTVTEYNGRPLTMSAIQQQLISALQGL
jgi:branched-chain amino acid aminotransferase